MSQVNQFLTVQLSNCSIALNCVSHSLSSLRTFSLCVHSTRECVLLPFLGHTGEPSGNRLRLIIDGLVIQLPIVHVPWRLLLLLLQSLLKVLSAQCCLAVLPYTLRELLLRIRLDKINLHSDHISNWHCECVNTAGTSRGTDCWSGLRPAKPVIGITARNSFCVH